MAGGNSHLPEQIPLAKNARGRSHSGAAPNSGKWEWRVGTRIISHLPVTVLGGASVVKRIVVGRCAAGSSHERGVAAGGLKCGIPGLEEVTLCVLLAAYLYKDWRWPFSTPLPQPVK